MEEPHTPEELARIHEQLWQTVLQFGNFSASQERNRIARDLHDSLGQALTALNIQLQTAVKLWQLDPQQAQQFLAEAQRLGSTAVHEVRQTVRTLRMDCPDDQSINTLITSLVDSFHRTTGVLPSVSLQLPTPLPPEVVTPIYRIIQEALNNICKYAQATDVRLHLSTTPTSLGLIITDNGRGFDPQQAASGFGLRGMQERVSLLRGRFQVETQPGTGCCIRITIPLRILSLQHDPEDLLPPPPTPETSISPPPAPPTPSVEPNAPVELASPLSTLTHLTRLSDPPPETLSLTPIAEPAAISTPDPTITTLSPQPEAAIISPHPDLPPLSGLLLTSEQHEHLTQILLEWVGPIAPLLLQQAILQAHHPADLVDALAVHLPSQHRPQFVHQLYALCSPAAAPLPPALQLVTSPPTLREPASGSLPPATAGQAVALNPELTHDCQHELTALIGPIAPVLLQEALAAASSLEHLLDLLTAHIPDPLQAARFKQNFLSQK